MRSLIKLFTFTIIVGAAIFPVYAFASSDSGFKASGEGTGTVSGWTISNVHYQLSGKSALAEGVSFDLDAPAGTVSVKLSTTSATYASCTNVTAYHWQCDFPAGVRMSDMDVLNVIAVGN
jgi:hypothetical protein